jgi:heptosyltransferase III
MTPIRLPSDARVLVVALRRLGDVLLTTPLIRSLKRGYPDCAIEALVFAGTQGILSGNPDLAGVMTIPERPSLRDSLSLCSRLSRRYDLAVSTQTGDRPTFLAWLAGRRRAGPLETGRSSASLKSLALHLSYRTDRSEHRVRDLLRLADLLGIPPCQEIVCPQGAVRPGLLPRQPYAVLHAAPKFTYKRWTGAGWRALAAGLRARGLGVVAIGADTDRPYLDSVWCDDDVLRYDGALAWPEVSALIRAARVYIGPDTAVTHLAAATGTPTVALYGPTDPRVWGPWPAGGLDTPWAAAGTIERRGNVWLVQNPLPCLPCQREGCERRLDSHSQCLDELPAAQVIAAVDQALAVRKAA